ncbi:MAG TPA: DUF4230 domain-containing protein [Acidobacteriaceae bacterium]|jgi:hypothetical protein|nr:DUF4230 domain-containing protein [Acidobacteriaceae bacterium]
MATVSAPARAGSRIVSVLVTAVLAGVLGGAGILALFLHEARHGVWDRVAGVLSGRRLRIDTAQPTVVLQVRRLARLESISYAMDKMVSGDRENRILPAFLTGDRILLEVHGEAIAGVDLNQLTSADVRIASGTVRIHLPPPRIFTVALDDQKTHVYARTTGILVPVDPSLEGDVREQAVENLRQSAVAAGILSKAQQTACNTVTRLLLGFGFNQVDCD